MIPRINEKESTITLKLSLSLSWVETRLTILPNATNETKEELVNGIYLPKKFINILWLPDAYIENVHHIEKSNFIRDYQTVFYSLDDDQNWLLYENEVEIDLFCKMTFESYPMDEQICYFLIGSSKEFEYSGQLFSLNPWYPIKFNNSKQVALQGYGLEINPIDDTLSLDSNYGYHFQRTGFEIRFHHNFWKYLMNYYIPSGILVIFSWVSEKLKHITKNYI